MRRWEGDGRRCRDRMHTSNPIRTCASFSIASKSPALTPRVPVHRRTTPPKQASCDRRWTGHYDVRRGAAAFAPIFGGFGALAVPGIVLIFQTPFKNSNLTALAAGLLALAVMGSLFGAVTLAAIGAEEDETANLPPAAVQSAVPTVISIVSMFGAFEVLAAAHVPATKLIFTAIAAVGGAFGIVFNSFTVGDSWGLGPVDDEVSRVAEEPVDPLARGGNATHVLGYVRSRGAGPGISGAVVRRWNRYEQRQRHGVNCGRAPGHYRRHPRIRLSNGARGGAGCDGLARYLGCQSGYRRLRSRYRSLSSMTMPHSFYAVAERSPTPCRQDCKIAAAASSAFTEACSAHSLWRQPIAPRVHRVLPE